MIKLSPNYFTRLVLRPVLSFVPYLVLGLVTSHAQTDLFKHLHFSAVSGLSIPTYDLAQTLNRSPTGEIQLSSPYYKRLKAHIILGYTLVATKKSHRSAHFVKAATGLEYTPSAPFWPRVGLSLGNYLLYTQEHPELFRVESEFGAAPLVYWSIPAFTALSLNTGLTYDIIFTAPKYAYLLKLYTGIEWAWW